MKPFHVTLIVAVAFLGGCASKPDASGPPPSQASVAGSIADSQQQIKDVQSNNAIPADLKPQIIARIQGNINRTEQAHKSQ